MTAPTPLGVRVLPRRLFYGWYIAIGASVVMFVGVGIGYYGLAVFLRPLQEEHGWSNATVSGATSAYFIISGLSGALFGPYTDRHGLRLMLPGFVLMAAAAALIGRVHEIWQLYAVYALLAVSFGMAAGVVINAMMARWFVRARARAMSISATGISVGGVVLTPVVSWLVDRGGVALAGPVLAVMLIVIAMPVIAFVLVFDPREIGLRPDGLAPGAVAPLRAGPTEASQQRRWRVSAAVRTVPFWGITIAFVLVLAAQTGFVIHQIAFLEDRLGSRNAAALALSTTAFGAIVARLVVGLFADAVDKRWLTVALFVIQGSAVLAVLHVESRWATYLLTLTFGFTIGNVYMMQSLLVGEIFGMVSFGAIFGIVAMAAQAGSGLGPFAVGWLEDRTGSYMLPFTLSAAITYLAAIAVVFARPIPDAARGSATVPTPEDAAGG
ncbi:MAG: MFS transporter [Chloroflexi bacterium]|nr:MFS transporter [Chloroflexota bacterium]MDA1001996.1 MFS transporter [Chloroflexota bacterium]